MARARNIKPGFFENEALVECSFAARLCFIGLWTLADREGRLEDRPRKIKMSLFPDDDVKADDLLSELAEQGLIVRYQAGDMSLISIPKFTKHQRPHQNESASELPGPDGTTEEHACNHGAKDGEPREKAVRPESPLLNDESLTPEEHPPRPRKQNTPTKPEGVTDEVWKDALDHRKRMKAPLTETAWKRMEPELRALEAEGWSPDDVIAEWLAAGWRAFKADWIRNRGGSGAGQRQSEEVIH